MRIDGRFHDIEDAPALDKKYKHDLEVVVDRLVVRPGIETRLADSLETALKLADGCVPIRRNPLLPDGRGPRCSSVAEGAWLGQGASSTVAYGAGPPPRSGEDKAAEARAAFMVPSELEDEVEGPNTASPEAADAQAFVGECRRRGGAAGGASAGRA